MLFYCWHSVNANEIHNKKLHTYFWTETHIEAMQNPNKNGRQPSMMAYTWTFASKMVSSFFGLQFNTNNFVAMNNERIQWTWIVVSCIQNASSSEWVWMQDTSLKRTVCTVLCAQLVSKWTIHDNHHVIMMHCATHDHISHIKFVNIMLGVCVSVCVFCIIIIDSERQEKSEKNGSEQAASLNSLSSPLTPLNKSSKQFSRLTTNPKTSSKFLRLFSENLRGSLKLSGADCSHVRSYIFSYVVGVE